MRRVDRSIIPIPAVLDGPLSKGGEEKALAMTHYDAQFAAGNESGKPSFEGFKMYKDETVRACLETLFHGKCAYCESRYAGTQPVDVEHWRPKARVVSNESPKRYRFGYYWLAAEWDNLLPSCIDCNRQRGHSADGGRSKLTLGKADWFPLLDPAIRAKDQASLGGEVSLLINPCREDPFADLAYHAEGYLFPCNPQDKTSELRALASIRFYALNRPELIKERRARLVLIEKQIATIRSLVDLLAAATPALASRIDTLLRSEFTALEKFREPQQPYAAMAYWFIRAFENSLDA